MRVTHTLALFLIVCSAFCQNIQQKGNPTIDAATILADRYKIDYEVEGLTSTTELITDGLDLEQYEYLRTESSDVIVFDMSTGQSLILYSWSKVGEKKLANLNKKIKGKAGTPFVEGF